MTDQERVKKEPLDSGITPEEIEKLIKERKRVGATSCKVETESGKSILVCRYPPL